MYYRVRGKNIQNIHLGTAEQIVRKVRGEDFAMRTKPDKQPPKTTEEKPDNNPRTMLRIVDYNTIEWENVTF